MLSKGTLGCTCLEPVGEGEGLSENVFVSHAW
jgi:hypothetical protein